MHAAANAGRIMVLQVDLDRDRAEMDPASWEIQISGPRMPPDRLFSGYVRHIDRPTFPPEPPMAVCISARTSATYAVC